MMHPTFIPRLIFGLVMTYVMTISSLSASDAIPELHERIDGVVNKRLNELKLEPAKLSSDEEFVRRIYLDLTGMIPTASQVRIFLSDKSSAKRQKLIDELLASPEYALHMARVFDVMLIERRIPSGGNTLDVPAAVWRAYLTEAFAENRPWNQIVKEILGSDGTDEKRAGAIKFYLARDVAPHLITRDVGRLLLGIDLQCAQCHDDPRIKEYRQTDYYGIYAFVQRMRVHAVTPRGALVAEVAEGNAKFVSVFTAIGDETNPRLPGGQMIPDPKLEKGKEYLVKPAPRERSIPVYSRRIKLAEQLPRHETDGFTRNIANRLWAHLFGRGIIHPLDLSHAANAPANPELLKNLEQWLVDHKYDIKGLLRQIALSQTYQRTSLLPNGVKELPAESYAVAPLRGLSAEQMRWSILQATGRVERQHSQKLTAKNAPKLSATDPLWKLRINQNDALERQSATLMSVFAGLPGQAEGGFQPVVDQALFLRNSSKFMPLLQDEPGLLLARLSTLRESDQIAEELYLSVLSRRPTADESQEVKQLLESVKELSGRQEALQAMLWGLLLSAEFRLNH